MELTLQQTVDGLESMRNDEFPEGMSIGLNLGEHGYCEIRSNCPLAVRLRTMVEEMGIDLEKFINEYQETPPDPLTFADWSNTISEVEGDLSLTIGGQTFHLDYTTIVTDHLKQAIQTRLTRMRDIEQSLVRLKQDYYSTYKNEVLLRRERRGLTLPGSFTSVDLASWGITMGTGYNGSNYEFILPLPYDPAFVFSRGQKYAILERHQQALRRDNVVLFLDITPNYKFRRAQTMQRVAKERKSHYTSFSHYHGSGGDDCWGSVVLPAKWEGTIGQLLRLRDELAVSLTTINKDSLMNSHPVDMLAIQTIMEKATQLGTEGEVTRSPDSDPDKPDITFVDLESIIIDEPRVGAVRRWGGR